MEPLWTQNARTRGSFRAQLFTTWVVKEVMEAHGGAAQTLAAHYLHSLGPRTWCQGQGSCCSLSDCEFSSS